MQIKGSFSVRSTPLEADSSTQQVGAMKMRFDKVFEGPLAGTSVVSMLGIMDRSTGSGAYVAIEKFEGQISSKNGSFCLAHNSSMDKNIPKQSVTVIPGTGTGELKNLIGHMEIDIKDCNHFYTFNYELEA